MGTPSTPLQVQPGRGHREGDRRPGGRRGGADQGDAGGGGEEEGGGAGGGGRARGRGQGHRGRLGGAGQAAARVVGRGHDGLQEGAGRKRRRPHQGLGVPAQEGARVGGQEVGPRRRRGRRGLLHPRRQPAGRAGGDQLRDRLCGARRQVQGAGERHRDAGQSAGGGDRGLFERSRGSLEACLSFAGSSSCHAP